jgi:hypothetical protein
MNTNFYKALTANLAIIFFVTSAQAGFNITRMTTIVDDFSGSYTVTKSGRLEDREYTGTSVTEFTNFHPFPTKEEANLSGTLSKTVESGNGRSITSDAELVLTGSEKSLNISFTGLSYIIENGVLNIAGVVTADDVTYDVTELPARLKKLLNRIFFLTQK